MCAWVWFLFACILHAVFEMNENNTQSTVKPQTFERIRMTKDKQRRGESNECKLFRSETKVNRKSLLFTQTQLAVATWRQHRVTQMLRRRCQFSDILWRTIRNTWRQWDWFYIFNSEWLQLQYVHKAEETARNRRNSNANVNIIVADSESVIFNTYDTRTFSSIFALQFFTAVRMRKCREEASPSTRFLNLNGQMSGLRRSSLSLGAIEFYNGSMCVWLWRSNKSAKVSRDTCRTQSIHQMRMHIIFR